MEDTSVNSVFKLVIKNERGIKKYLYPKVISLFCLSTNTKYCLNYDEVLNFKHCQLKPERLTSLFKAERAYSLLTFKIQSAVKSYYFIIILVKFASATTTL